MPFLEVLTRCYKRPRMLAANRASLQAQPWLKAWDAKAGGKPANGNGAGPEFDDDYVPEIMAEEDIPF